MPIRSSRPTASMSHLTDITMLTEPFMIRALLAALFLAPLCALLGVFVTARRMSFFSDTVSHAESEEHTSELQSLRHLVCRLLLEKKKTNQEQRSSHIAIS